MGVETKFKDSWANGLAGYDIALTWQRSPIRIRLGPLFSDTYSIFSLTFSFSSCFEGSEQKRGGFWISVTYLAVHSPGT